MTPEAPTHPVIQRRDDEGTYGLDVTVTAMDSETILLKAKGASVVTSNQGDSVLLFVRSGRRDFEGDSLYLFLGELVPGATTWYGPACEIKGVFTKFLYRTEEELDVEIAQCPSGDGIYVPEGPLDNDAGSKAWYGRPAAMIQAKVKIRGRQPERKS